MKRTQIESLALTGRFAKTFESVNDDLSKPIRRVPQFNIIACFLFPACILPAEFGLDEGADAREQVYSAVGREQAESDAAQEQVVEMDNALGARGLSEFGPIV